MILAAAALVVGLASFAPAAPSETGAAPATRDPSAPRAMVLLLRPAHPAPATAEALVRLRGELIAAGFAVQVADVPASADLRAAVDRASVRTRADAVIAILGDPARQSAELRIVDRATGKTVARQVPVPVESSRAAEILSIRALELLRASLLEVALASGAPPRAGAAPPPTERRPETGQAEGGARATETPGPAGKVVAATREEPPAEPGHRASREQPPSPPRPPARSDRPAVAAGRRASADASTGALPGPPTSRFAVELGGIVLGSFEGLPPSVLPVVRGTVRLSAHIETRLALAGLGTRARVQTADATTEATVAQSFGLVEVALAFRSGARVQPFLSLGAGAAHLSIEGHASSPYESRAGSLWTAIIDAGLGLRIGLGRRFQLAAEAHAQGAYTYPVVRFLDMTLAQAGRPTVLGGLSLITWL